MKDTVATPGPWFSASQLDQLYVIAGRPPSINDDVPFHEAERTVIAKIYTESEADANLIASAPEMAKEIERLRQYEQAAGMLAIEKAEQRIRADAAEKRIAQLESQPSDQFTADLVEIDGHTYGLRPGAARVVREALRDAERWRLARTLLLMRVQETMAGTRRYGLMVRPGYSFLDALGDPARAYLNQNNFDEECCRVDEAFDAAMAKDGA